MTDTIHALATAPGKAAVAVVRISGPRAEDVLARLSGPPPRAREARVRALRAANGERIDQAMVIWMPRPASFTGEDCAELHLHGGRAGVDAVLNALSAAGSRPAEAGEFTRRAFENGKLSLLEAEGVADLVDAETAAQHHQALQQLHGEGARRVADWRGRLLRALAHLEAAVDFPDEDLPQDVADRARPELEALRNDLAEAAADRRGEQVREGLRIALVGAPNAGKSSLLNALVGREAAIVSVTPGTTRDIVEVRLELGGVPCTLADTAGLRSSTDEIEREGVRRAEAWAQSADLRLWVIDPSARCSGGTDLVQEGDWVIVSKADQAVIVDAISPDHVQIATSTVSLGGVHELRRSLEAWAAERTLGDEPPVVTRKRHRDRLVAAMAHLDRALYADAPHVELLAEDVRLTIRELERLTGRIDAEAVLGEIFSAFCIGK